MKRNLLLVVAVLLILLGLVLLTQVVRTLRPAGQGALQVTANIKSTVAIDGKVLGDTPLCKCEENNTVKAGEYTLTVTPKEGEYTPFVVKVKVSAGVLTAIDRTFLPGSLASAYVLSLEKTQAKDPQLVVSTIPDAAMIAVDSTPKGVTPFSLDSITASEHEIEIQKDGYAKKTIRIKTVPEYKLVVSAFLGTESAENAPQLQKISPTPTVSPSPSKTQSSENTLEILTTPVGFLRVRSLPSTAGDQLTTVAPGDTFSYTDTQNGWYKITLEDGTEGWISGTYVRVNQ